ncbi:unnamed protein product [Schistosoma curassoni]|uniref:Peptidase A2 domain-containing protein n=1 Tax=Schistosoma curassoni TaxID=6186 RepID=A0A183KCB5_9TREM|nr:unnamed protein product [Schistosoma curassoni]
MNPRSSECDLNLRTLIIQTELENNCRTYEAAYKSLCESRTTNDVNEKVIHDPPSCPELSNSETFPVVGSNPIVPETCTDSDVPSSQEDLSSNAHKLIAVPAHNGTGNKSCSSLNPAVSNGRHHSTTGDSDEFYYLDPLVPENVLDASNDDEKSNTILIDQVAVQAFRRLDMMGREELIRSRFVKGLLPGPLKEHFLRNPPTDTSDVKRTTLRFLAADKLVNLSNAHSSSVTTVKRATKSSGPDTCRATIAVTDLPGRGAIRGQSNSRWNIQPAWGNYNGRQVDCIYCKRFGRNARRCGHNRPRKPGKRCFGYLSSHVNHANPTTFKGRVQNIELDILLDTGASVSLIKEDFLQRLNHSIQRKQCSSTLITASEDPLITCSKIGLELTINKNSFRHEFLVCLTLTWNMILGVDFMLRYQASIDMSKSEAKIGGVVVQPQR